MMSKIFFYEGAGRWLILLVAASLVFTLATCGGGGGSDSSTNPDHITITGMVDDGSNNAPLANAECRFMDTDGQTHDTDTCDSDGVYRLSVPAALQGYILCSPQSIPNLNLSTFSSTLNSAAGDTITNEDVTPTTTLTADILRYENASDPQARKAEVLHTIATGQDANLVLVATMATRLYQTMLAQQVNLKFGGDRRDGGDGDDDGRGDDGGVGGEAGDGADFSPLAQAECTFVVGDGLATAEPFYPSALVDYWADGRLNRPDLKEMEDTVHEGLEYTPEQIQEAFAEVFLQGPGQPIATTTDDQGRYFLPIPAKVDGYVRCRPQGQEKLMLGTYIPARQEGEIREDEDVTPATTLFGSRIASQMEGDLATVKENFLADIDGLTTLLSGPNLPHGPLTEIGLGTETTPANSDVGLVAFSVTALFNALYKNGYDVDYIAAIADLADNALIDPENPVNAAFLESLGLPADQAQALAALVNDAIGTTATALGNDLVTALSTARVNVTVMVAEADGGGPIADAEIDIKNALPCEGCGDATDANGQLTLTLSGVSQQARRFGVTVSSVAGYEPVTVATEVVAFATVDLDVILSAATNYRLVVQAGEGDGNGVVTSDPAGIDCAINDGTVSGDFSAPFLSGTQVVLRATADEDSAFVGWAGACTGGEATSGCTLTMETDTTVTALFSRRCVDSAYAIDNPEAAFAFEGGEGSFNVTAPEGCPWSAAVDPDADWMVIDAGSGSGDGRVTYRVLENESVNEKSASIIVSGQRHRVTQAPAPCIAVISSEGQGFPHTGGTGNITVAAPEGCEWSASVEAGVDWIRIDAGGSGSGIGEVQYTVLANDGPERTGTLTVGDQVHTVTQAPADCAYTLSPEPPDSVPADGGSYEFSVDATHDGCGWSAFEEVDWISIETTTTRGDGTASLMVDPNTGVGRSADITIAFTTIQITQEAAACTYAIEPARQEGVPFEGGSYQVEVIPSYEGCTTPWEARSNDGWILVSNDSGMGRDTVTYSVSESHEPERTGSITVAEQTHWVTQVAGPCPYSIYPVQQENVPARGGTYEFSVIPSYAGCQSPWSVSHASGWIEITSGGSGSGDGTVSYRVLANASPSSRAGDITLNEEYSPDEHFHSVLQQGDATNPSVSITSPTADPIHTTTSTINISGTASDDVRIDRVSWTNDQGGSGTCTGTAEWSADEIGIEIGENLITVTAHDAADNEGTDTLTVIYEPLPVVTVSVVDIDGLALEGSDNDPNNGVYRISRTGSTASSLRVNISMDGEAVNGTDYETISGPVDIAADASYTDIVLRPLDDPEDEPDEAARLTIERSSNYSRGHAYQATVPIIDDDDSLLIDCPRVGDDAGDLYDRGFYVRDYPGTSLTAVNLHLSTMTPGLYSLSLTVREDSYDGQLVGTATIDADLDDSIQEFGFIFDQAPRVTQGSVLTFEIDITSGPVTSAYPVHYVVHTRSNCPVVETEGTTPPLDQRRRDGVAVSIFGDLH